MLGLALCFSSVSSVIDRAGEQEKLNVNGTVTIQNGVNVTEQLNLDFYLGIYAGETVETLLGELCCYS